MNKVGRPKKENVSKATEYVRMWRLLNKEKIDMKNQLGKKKMEEERELEIKVLEKLKIIYHKSLEQYISNV